MAGETVTYLSKTVAKKTVPKHLAALQVGSKPCVDTVSNTGKQTTVFYALLKGHKISTGNLKMKIHYGIT